MMAKKIEKIQGPQQNVPANAEAVQSIRQPEATESPQKQVEKTPPKVIEPKQKTQKPVTRDELKALLQQADEKSGILGDSRLAEVVEEIPDWRVGLFGKALQFFHDDVRVFLSHRDKIKDRSVEDPKAVMAKLLGEDENFAFCVHPLTGMTLIADAESGHPEMMSAEGVFGNMQARFSVGASFTEVAGGKMVTELMMTKPALIEGMTQEEASKVAHRILCDMGLPAEIRLAQPLKTGGEKEALIQRKTTLGGKQIPVWNGEKSGVVFDEGYCYTSFPIHTEGGLHARAVMTIQRFSTGPFDVFNNVQGSRGQFRAADLPTLADGHEMRVSGPDHLMIVRAKGRADIPSPISAIGRAMQSRTFHEISKGD